MKLDWKHLVLGGGFLLFLRHIGFALGFASQVVYEGWLEGVTARKSVNQDTSDLADLINGKKS